MTADCGLPGMWGFEKADIPVIQKMEQLTNIRREGEKLIITTGGEELVMEGAAREAVTAILHGE